MTDILASLTLGKQLRIEQEPRMDVEIVLIVLVVALMILVILSFVCFLVALKCHRKKEDQYSEWIRSASIEHLRFNPSERDAHRNRTSTPCNLEIPTYEEFIGSRSNNYLGMFYSGYSNPLDAVDNPVQMTESEKSRSMFQTFTNTNEPKYIYWETRV